MERASHSKVRYLWYAAIAVGPFAYILTRVSFSELLQVTRQTAWWTVPLCVALTITVILLQWYRWHMLLQVLIPTISSRLTLATYLKSLYYSIVLPTSAGQDIARAIILSGKADLAAAWASTWMCRLLGLCVLVCFAFIGILSPQATLFPAALRRSVLGMAVLTVILIGLSFSKTLTSAVREVAESFLPQGLFEKIAQIRQTVYAFRLHRDALLRAFLLTVMTQLVVVLNSCVIILGISGQFPFGGCLILVPIIEIICMSIPLTPGGVGVRETMSLLLLRYLGLRQEHIALYMTFGVLGFVLRIIGIIPILWDMRDSKAQKMKGTKER